jgi:protein disulfide-isomerase A1
MSHWRAKLTHSVLVSYGETIPGFDEYANSARDSYLFGHYADSNLPTLPESVSLPAIILFKQFDEGYAVFPADQVSSASSESLAAFVKENSVPLFDEISPENFGTYAGQGLPIAYLFADPESASERDALVKELTPLAKEHKGKMSFVHIDAIKFIEHGKSLNLAGDSWPAFVIQDLAEGTKYPLTESVSKANVEKFVKAFSNGEVKPSIKSEAVPSTNDAPVFHLVSDQWDEVLGDKEKDILVEFFAPWCGHCRKSAIQLILL